MRITRHRYRVKPEYVAQNRQNLDEFIAALRAREWLSRSMIAVEPGCIGREGD
jgi:hypothetical protein